jgi:hypothetical protein
MYLCVSCDPQCKVGIFLSRLKSPLVGQGLLITEASRSHSDTSHSTGLLYRSNIYLTTQHSQATDIHASAEIQTRENSTQEAADPRHRLRGHSDRHQHRLVPLINWLVFVIEIVAFLCGVGTEIFQYYFGCFRVLNA